MQDTLWHVGGASATTMELIGAGLFAIALLHTFSAGAFERLARRHPRHAGLLHLLGEVEVVFGFWAGVLVLFIFALSGGSAAVAYLEAQNFTEPLFVFAIMVMAGTRPVLLLAGQAARLLARWAPMDDGVALYLMLLSVVPLLGSLITEPAAMTLAALMLRDRFFAHTKNTRLLYATLGVLFVNVSIGGTLTSFAAPPVLMVAAKWGWDTPFMLRHFGGPAAIAVFVNAAIVTTLFRRELQRLGDLPAPQEAPVPLAITATHLVFLAALVATAHHPAVFLGLLLFFMGFCAAYERHQSPLLLRESLLVAFFLAGLVVLGSMQRWWLAPVLSAMSVDSVFYGAAALTAVTDNAALTYLGSLVPGLADDFKIALVGGAVAGGGLTVIANAPNPAGVAILRGRFPDHSVHPLGLLAAAALPTLVAITALRVMA